MGMSVFVCVCIVLRSMQEHELPKIQKDKQKK